MKRCSICKVEKELNEFNKDKSRKDGLMYKCKLCEKQYYLLNREKIKQYYQLNREEKNQYQKEYNHMNREKINQYQNQYKKRSPEKQKARVKLNDAVRTGKIHKPLYCSSCEGDKHLEAHHTDYTKPLEVLWLCRTCHVDLHRGLREESRKR